MQKEKERCCSKERTHNEILIGKNRNAYFLRRNIAQGCVLPTAAAKKGQAAHTLDIISSTQVTFRGVVVILSCCLIVLSVHSESKTGHAANDVTGKVKVRVS